MDPAGTLTSSPKYDVYGGVRGNGGTPSTAHGFVGGLGHLTDKDTGLVYMRARYYDPQTGRFISEDPAKNGSNWLVYADDNPVNKLDKNGHLTQQDFAAFMQLRQDIELGAGCISRNAAEGSLAASIAAAGGSVRTLMKLDTLFEVAAQNGVGMTAEEAGYALWKESVMDAIGVARGYVGGFISGSQAQQDMETATDLLIDIL